VQNVQRDDYDRIAIAVAATTPNMADHDDRLVLAPFLPSFEPGVVEVVEGTAIDVGVAVVNAAGGGMPLY